MLQLIIITYLSLRHQMVIGRTLHFGNYQKSYFSLLLRSIINIFDIFNN